MLNRKTLTAVALVATGLSAPVLAEDDVPTAKVLLEQARSYGAIEPTGMAAGAIEAARESRKEAARKQLNANEKLWELTSKQRGTN